MKTENTFIASLAIITANMFGAVSLLLFGAFLFFGPLEVISLGLSPFQQIIWNTFLSLLFFAQHSLMIRRSFKREIMKPVPPHYHGWMYTMASALVLFLLLIFWQPSYRLLLEIQGFWRWALRGIFLAGGLGFLWSASSLHHLDAFGTRMIEAHVKQLKTVNSPLASRGPYQYVRHPIYFFVLLMIWSCPEITPDRLLFNSLFTLWMVLATSWEEKDLKNHFGKEYLEYQKKVPMLIPWKILKN
jgi:protein-S-isoprenylcysteine O-methyltransferase Ste14